MLQSQTQTACTDNIQETRPVSVLSGLVLRGGGGSGVAQWEESVTIDNIEVAVCENVCLLSCVTIRVRQTVLQSDVVYRPDCLLAGQTQTGAASVCQSPPACQLAQMRGERQGRCHCLTGASRQASQPTKKASQPTEYLEINLGKSLSFPSPAPSVCPASQTFHYILYFMVAS